MRILITGLFLISFLADGFAQRYNSEFPSETWHTGSVTLNDGKTLEGNIKYDLNADAIQLSLGDKILTYAANQIRQFKIFQEDQQVSRAFFSIPFTNEFGYKRPKLFELLHEGKTSLLAREFISIATRTSNDPYFRRYSRFDRLNSGSVRVRYLDYKFYLASSEGKIELLGSTKNDVIFAFKNNRSELKKFIKKRKLKMDRIEDMTTLVRHYNTLQSF